MDTKNELVFEELEVVDEFVDWGLIGSAAAGLVVGVVVYVGIAT